MGVEIAACGKFRSSKGHVREVPAFAGPWLAITCIASCSMGIIRVPHPYRNSVVVSLYKIFLYHSKEAVKKREPKQTSGYPW